MPILRPEQAFAHDYFHNEEELSDAELEVERTLVRKMTEYKPDFEDFENIYSKTEIDKDKQKLEKQKSREIKESHQRALILEAILGHQIEQADWFGPNCSVAFAAEYDDRFSHADLILEFDQGKNIPRLAVDVTIASNPKTFEKKRNYIKKDIETGKLTNLKYFISEVEPEEKGHRFGLPRVIIGTDIETVKELSETIAKSAKKELAKSNIQIELLESVKSQLEDEIEYANYSFKKFDTKKHKIITKHEEVLEIIKQVLKNKKASGIVPKAHDLTKINWENDIRASRYLAQKGY